MVRSKLDLLMNLIISDLIIIVVLFTFIKRRSFDRSFWLSAPMFIVIVFLKNRYIEEIHNYQYMKAYTMFLPIIYVLAFISINFCSRSKSKVIEYTLKASGMIMVILICINGLLYITKYKQECGYVTKDMFDLACSNQSKILDSYAVATNKLTMDELMLTPIIPMNWLNLNYASTTPFFEPHLNKRFAIIISKKNLKHVDNIRKEYTGAVLYENPSFLIIDTKKTVLEFYDEKTKQCDIGPYLRKIDEIS